MITLFYFENVSLGINFVPAMQEIRHYSFAYPMFFVLQSPSHVWLFWSHRLCDPPDSSVHRISQAGILEWVTISSSMGSSWPWDQTRVSYLLHCLWILYHWATREALHILCNNSNSEASTQNSKINVIYLEYLLPPHVIDRAVQLNWRAFWNFKLVLRTINFNTDSWA